MVYCFPVTIEEGTNAQTAIAKIKELGKAGDLDALRNYVATNEERSSVLAAAEKFIPKQ